MQDAPNSLNTSLADLDKAAWKAGLTEIAEDCGMFQPLGPHHFATFVDEGDTLLVTFETVAGIRSLSDDALPLGFELVRRKGWSHLCIISDGDTWFRDPLLYGFFDRLIDDGFFEDFDRVVFYGAGPCAYAAAAYSVASPGATVLAIQPQATLDPRMTEWDNRFPEMRRVSFTDRYGYAPDMLEPAAQAFVLYDPRVQLDAMHATLFQARNVTRLRLWHMGEALQTNLIEMKLLVPLIAAAGAGKLTAAGFHRVWRKRRDYRPYLQNLLQHLARTERDYLQALLCRNVTHRMHAPKFQRFLDRLERRAEHGETLLPAMDS